MKKTEVVIDFRDLIAEYIRKSWIIVIVTILMACLLCGLKYYKAVENYEAIKSSHAENVDINDLSKEEQEQVTNFLKKYDEQKNELEYLEDSILLSCDPYNVYVMDMSFAIDVEEKKGMGAFWHMYRDYICNNELATDICKAENEYTARIWQEVFLLYNGVEGEGILDVRVFAKDEEQLEYLTDVVENQIRVYNKELISKIGKHDLILIEERKLVLNMATIEETRANTINKVNGLKGELDGIWSNLPTEQKTIISKILEDDDYTVTDGVEAVSVEIEIKYLIIGALVGILISCFGIFISYYFSSKIKTHKEIKDLYGLELLGASSLETKNMFEKIAHKIVFRDKADYETMDIEYISEKIAKVLKNKNCCKVYFVGEVNGLAKKEIEKIVRVLLSKKIEVKYIGDVLKDQAALTSLESEIPVVIVSCLRKTEYARIDKEIQLCTDINVGVLGYVSLEK